MSEFWESMRQGREARAKEDLNVVHNYERCARCGCFAPSSTLDPDLLGPDGLGASPLVAEGWGTFQTEPVLVLDIPWEGDFQLPDEVVDAINNHDGPIRCERPGPEIKVACVRETEGQFVGLVCSVCQQETEWSTEEWLAWFALQPQGGDA